VKWYEKKIGDGIFFQWVFCSAVWVCGFIVYATREFPPFEPLAILGGFLWCTGNILTVPIIKCIGLSLGMLIWGLCNLIMGWLSGSLGWFDLAPETVKIRWLNIMGGIIAMLSGAFFAAISKNTPNDIKQIQEIDPYGDSFKPEETEDFFDSRPEVQKRVLGVGMAIIAGFLYGTNFVPPQYLIDNCATCPKEQIDYVFPHFCGIYITSTVYMLIYCLVKKNSPIVPSEIGFPAFLSGLMWSMAMISWFIANTALELVIAYPIITIMPGVIASAWGIFAFHEITGARNFALFTIGFIFCFASVACTVISKG
jgi:glucose uptake protein GlcU